MVDLRLATLTVVNKADRLGRDEPMLWTMFIVLSVETIGSRQFVVRTDPVKGRLAKAGKAPAAMINRESEAIVAVGAIISDIPMVDQVDVDLICSGDRVRVDGGAVTIERA